jgi:replicative DNA helicase
MYAEQLPPHDVEAEECVLGCVLIDHRSVWPVVSSLLTPEDFYRDSTRHIYEAMKILDVIDQVTVAGALNNADQLEEVGGPAYLSHLIALVPTPLHAEAYVNRVKQCGDARRLIAAAGELAALGYESKPYDAQSILERIKGLQAARDRSGFQPLKDIAGDMLDDWDEWLAGEAKPHGLRTGLVGIDGALDGFGKGRLYVIAGRPSMGKSDLAMTILQRVAEKGAIPGYVSLEMPAQDMLRRMAFARVGLDRYAMPKGPSEDEAKRLWDSWSNLQELPMYVWDAPGLNTSEIKAAAMALKKGAGLDILCVDHMGQAEDNPFDAAYQRMSLVSRRLLGLAKTLDIPVIAVCQLNRACEMRPGKHIPQLSDLRDSGTIEQDAYAVLMLWRYDYYHREEGKKRDSLFHEDDPKERNVLHIYIRKNRGGPQGHTRLFYDTAAGRIGNLTKEEERDG